MKDTASEAHLKPAVSVRVLVVGGPVAHLGSKYGYDGRTGIAQVIEGIGRHGYAVGDQPHGDLTANNRLQAMPNTPASS